MPRRQARLEAPAAARREPLDVEPERELELVQATQRLGVVAVGGHDQRAAVAVAGRQPGALLQLGREGGPALAGGQVHAHEPLLAEVGLHHRREHARGHARSAVPGSGRAIDHEHGQAALLGAPRAGEADQTGTDHNGVVACAPRQLNLLPFAGITRVRFDGRRRRSRPLSPVSPSSRWALNPTSAIHSSPDSTATLQACAVKRGNRSALFPVRRSLPCAMKRLTITIAMLVAAAVAAPAANASSQQLLVMQDDAQVRSAPDTTLVRVRRPRRRRRQAQPLLGRGRAERPAQAERLRRRRSRSYAWGSYDTAVAGDPRARHAALPQPRRPRAARGPPTAGAGRAPCARARRSSTCSPRPPAQHFPGVHIWSIWNEPNLDSWLGPQRSKGTPLSPSIYRGLYLAGYRGLNDARPSRRHDPARRADAARRDLALARCARSSSCARWRAWTATTTRSAAAPPRSAAAARSGASRPRASPTTRTRRRPARTWPRAATTPRSASCRACARRSTRSRGAASCPRHLPIWITEFGYQTKPPDPLQGAPLKRAAAFMDESEWIAFRNPRVASYSQYTLLDDPPRPGLGPAALVVLAGRAALPQRQEEAVRLRRLPPARVRAHS